MKILFLSPYAPYPPYGGGAMRIYQLIRGLAARHEVTCLTFAPDDEAERALAPLQAICRVLTVRGPLARGLLRRAWTTLASPLPDMALRNASRAYVSALADVFARECFDIVQAESIEMAGYLQVAATCDCARPVQRRVRPAAPCIPDGSAAATSLARGMLLFRSMAEARAVRAAGDARL